MTDYIYRYSENIDRFLSDDNSSYIYANDEQKSSLELSPFMTFEDKRDPEYRFKVQASLRLPRTSQKLSLSFEDYSSSDSIDDVGNKTDQNNDNNYLLGLEYFSYRKALSSLNFGFGIKLNNAQIDPYVTLKIQKQLDAYDGRITISNRLKYFLNLHVDNRLECYYGYFMSDTTKFQWLNSYRYRDEKHTHELSSTFRIHNMISKKKNIYADINIYLLKNNTTPFDINYYKTGFHYHKNLHKEWLYYEIAPALMFRIENDYKPTARIFLTLGLVLGKSYRYSSDRFYSNY
jgi:hypothetical protein